MANNSSLARMLLVSHPLYRSKPSLIEHFDLIPHWVPKSDVERALFTAGLHRLLGKPAKPFAHADGRDVGHHDLVRVGGCDLHPWFEPRHRTPSR